MNVTVPTLAPLEDILVEEITEHENRCELEHLDGAACAVVAVALSAARCTPRTQLACEVGVRRFRYIVALCESTGTTCGCGREPSDCWSLVMLP